MQVVLNFPESEAAHVLAFLNRHPAIRLVARTRKRKMDETEYLMSNPVNAKRLMEAIERTRRGEYVIHDLIKP